ncbi:Protein FAM198A [Merluccius polli]|uniref:Protein FAM198A n=1 Tax=Merluccius polli TaxID=89951 RepID=A0AA47MPT4_MERPO|nr:Protein FAM198A [Merluccius polli]
MKTTAASSVELPVGRDDTAWRRVRSKRCFTQRWLLLLLYPVVLLFLTASVMMMMITTVPVLPYPPAHAARRPSRALSSAGGVASRTSLRAGDAAPAAPHQNRPGPLLPFQLPPLPNVHSGSWRAGRGGEKEPPKRLETVVEPIRRHGRMGATKDEGWSQNRNSSKGIAFKRKERSGTSQRPANRRHSLLAQFTVNNKGPRGRIKPGNSATVVEPFSKTHNHTAEGQTTDLIPALANTPVRNRKQADRRADGQANLQAKISQHAGNRAGRQEKTRADPQLNKGRHPITKLSEHDNGSEKMKGATKHLRKSDKIGREQQAVKRPSRDLKKQHHISKELSKRGANDPSAADRKKPVPKHKAVVKNKEDKDECRDNRRQEFPDSDRRKVRRSPDAPWLSDDDLQKMELLAAGEVVSKARVPAHGQILQVALNHSGGAQQSSTQTPTGGLDKDQSAQRATRRVASESHGERCQRGSCSLVKRPDDWYEVLAFHLDRVLGLNRSLPAVLRAFPQSDVLPYRYTSGAHRPVVWWDPNIQHLDDRDNDQNSVPLSWVQYQELLKVHCGKKADLNSAPCVGVQHSEWGRLALFDFLLQVNDRLDRCCCGFRPDPKESCVENLLYVKCHNSKELRLVHILVRKTDPSRMVFIDNAGRPHQPADNLNFRLVEGIDERYPCCGPAVWRALLLRSLYTDREFWERHGGAGGLRTLIRTMDQRGRILLQHIRDKRLRLNRDL